MKILTDQMEKSPAVARAAPFVVFLLLTSCQGFFGETSAFWFYCLKMPVGLWLIWLMYPRVPEMRWRFSWAAVATGLAVLVIWVGLDGLYLTPKRADAGWNPHLKFGQDSILAWFLVLVRIVGSSLIVPPLEEVFYRSFLYRFLSRHDFTALPLGQFHWLPFVVCSAIFGTAHPQQWLAGILCGLAYQGLVCWKKRLGDAMTAHAITNFLLGLWVVSQDAWQFW